MFLAYEGFGLITNTAEEMGNPKKTLPRALYLAVIITMVIYVLVSLTVLGNSNSELRRLLALEQKNCSELLQMP